MLIVVGLGGNALVRRGQAPDLAVQRANAAAAAAAIAPLCREHEVVVTHGNGPQVGLLALQSESTPAVRPAPLDVLDAQTEGLIGYLLEQELGNRLPGRECLTVLTQVVVDPADPAFAAPTKPVGPVYPEAEARRLAVERSWEVAPDTGGWRRVVPSPEPVEIVELAPVERLVEAGVIVIGAGGGGIPVARDADGGLRGVEAVVDKDRTSALLAAALAADALLLLTDVPAVFVGWDTPDARRVRSGSPEALAALDLAPGSMAPKVGAACRFVEETGAMAAIGALADAEAVLAGEAGTRIARDAGGLTVGDRPGSAAAPPP